MVESAQLVGQLEPSSASPVAAVCNWREAEAALSNGQQETAAILRPACWRREGKWLRIVVLWPVIIPAAARASHSCALKRLKMRSSSSNCDCRTCAACADAHSMKSRVGSYSMELLSARRVVQSS